LRGFGVPGPIRLNTMGPIDSPRSRLWHVTLFDAKKRLYNAYLTPDGRFTHVFRGSEQSHLGHGKPNPLEGARFSETATAWLKHSGCKEQVRLDPPNVDVNGYGRATFRILRTGLPFVSLSHYKYVFGFSVPGRKFLSFRANKGPPPVNAATPKLDKA